MLYVVNKITNIQKVDFTYTKTVDSYLEADAIHGTIERCRKSKIYLYIYITLQENEHYLYLL